MKRYTRWVLVVFAAMFVFATAHGAEKVSSPVSIPPQNEILKTLRKGHPRLLISAQDVTRIQQEALTNVLIKGWVERLRKEAQQTLKQEPSKYEIPDGLRLLATSRRVVRRTYTLALMYRLDGDKRYVDRAWLELSTAAAFTNWNTRHFLDTAEMAHAFAIGYDWLFDQWTPEQREVLRAAMVDKGLKPGLAAYRGEKPASWTKARHNWNQVCNGGLGMAALALADVEPELTSEFLPLALESLQLPMAEFAPDGAWAEGPGYWNYATDYNIIILAGLQTALGTDYGLSKIPGFAEAGMFPIYITSPLGVTFNYADAGSGAIRAPHMFWMSRQFNRPIYTAYQRAQSRGETLDLVWYDARLDKGSLSDLPLDKYFRNSEVVTLRSAWADRNALFLGMKGGDNKANHSNLDLGSFVFDALGVRWAAELGADDYNLPGYFGKQRWSYYRMRAEGHNTLVINPRPEPDQALTAKAKIIKYDSKPARAIAVTDLTEAYTRDASSVRRGMQMLNRRQVLIQDEVRTLKPSEVWWFLHTSAAIQISDDKRIATMEQDEKRVSVRILSPQNASFSIMAAEPLPASAHPEKQATNGKIRKLAVQLKDVSDLRLVVLLTPLAKGETENVAALPAVPLSEW